jgi:eukaryotic-like serine/threonine-protein kinase
MDAQQLQRLSGLLDEALDLAGAEREAWLDRLARDNPALGASVRELLSRDAAGEAEKLIGASLRLPALASVALFGAGDQVGPYRLLRKLGTGGMGEVWLAERHDGSLQRPVALKLPLLVTRRQLLVQLFERERDILAGLAHPHIARLLDAGLADDGQPFLALEYVQGRNIVTHCDEEKLDLHQRVALMQQVLGAVQHAHANLVVHRDLKPSNVLVTADGKVMLLDFGIAKLLQAADQAAVETELTRLGVRAMTPEHAAPEQLRGGPISIATDVWALGVLLYQLVAGRRPFQADHRSALERLVLEADPPRPTVVRHQFLPSEPRLRRTMAADLDTIVLKALKKPPSERYVTAAAMSEDLNRWLDGQPVLAQPDSRRYRLRKFVGRHRWTVTVSSVAVFALMTTAGVALWQAGEAREQAERARAEAARAEAVQNFLVDIFRTNRAAQRDPERARQTTARELLDAGAARLEQSLKDAPESRIQVLATLAEMYSDLGLHERAVELDRARFALASRELSVDDSRRAAAALSLSQRLHTGAGREEARALLDQATAVLASPALRDSPLQLDLARTAWRFYRYESLRKTRDQADAMLRIVSARQPPNPVELADAHLRAGVIRLTSLDLAGAAPLLARSHDLMSERARTMPAALIAGSADLADLQMSIGRFDAAEATLRSALAASETANGPEHRQTLVLGTHLVYLLERIGRRRDADAGRAHIEAAMARAGELLEEGFRRNAQYLLSRNQRDAGRPDLLEPLLSEAVREIDRDLQQSPAAAHRRRLLAEVLTDLGRLDEAEPLLDEALAIWRRFAEGVSEPWMESNLHLARAELRLAQQRPQEALAILTAVAPSRLPADAPLDLRGLRRDLALARVWLALGDASRAATAAESVVNALAVLKPPLALPAVEAHARWLLGEALRRLGRGDAGRSELQRAVALRRLHDAPHSRWLAQAEQALAAFDGSAAAAAVKATTPR